MSPQPPLEPLHLHPPREKIGTAVVVGYDVGMASLDQGGFMEPDYTVGAGDTLFAALDFSQADGSRDALVLKVDGGHIVMALTVQPPSQYSGPVRDWLMGDGKYAAVPVEPTTSLGIDTELILLAHWTGPGVTVEFAVDAASRPASPELVTAFRVEITPPPAGQTAIRVRALAPYADYVDWLCGSVPSKRPRPIEGATYAGQLEIAVRRRAYATYYEVEYPDGEQVRMDEVPESLTRAGNQTTIWRTSSADWVWVPDDRWYSRPLTGRGTQYWTRAPEGPPR